MRDAGDSAGAMDLEAVAPDALGRSLTGLGVNLLTRDVRGLAGFLGQVFGLSLHRLSDDFAIVAHGAALIQFHSDTAFRAYPLPGRLPEADARGAGMQLHLFGIDPDAAAARAEASGHHVPEPVADKPRRLRECTILSPEGYAVSPVMPTGRYEA